MGDSKPQYVIVGAFVVVMLIALVYALIRLSGWTAETDRYFTVFTNVTGVTEGTKVFYEGFPIGRVARIRPLTPDEAAADPVPDDTTVMTRFRLDLEVQKGWGIARSATAELAAPGFLSAVIVGIRESAPGAPVLVDRLPPESYIPGHERESLDAAIRSLGSRAGTVADAIQSLIVTTEATIVQRINPTIDDGRALVQAIARDVPPILQKADALMVNLDALVDDARGFTSEGNRAEVEQLLVRLNAAAADLDRLTGNANTLVDEARALIADVKPDVNQSLANVRYLTGALARDIDTISRNLEGASRNMHEFSRQIRQNPGMLLGGTTPGGSR